jgi:molecular chaperone GrpE
MVPRKDKHMKKDIVTEEKKPKAQLDLEEKLTTALQEIENWKNKYYMVFADMENARKQNEKSLSEALKYRAAGFVENIFPILDAFQIALDMKTEDEAIKRFLVGFEHLYRQLKTVLENEGVKDVSPNIGASFDYKTMHALDTEEADGEENRVLRIIARGYQLKDRLIRPAMVILSKKKAPIQDPQPQTEPQTKTKADPDSQEFDA